MTSVTSKLSDAEIAAQLREMGQDIGPVNVATRGVYQRKLERLLLEQSSLLSVAVPDTPPKESEQTRTLEKVATKNPEVSFDATTEMEDDFELDEICDGSLRIEEEEEEESFMGDKLMGDHELDRNEFGVNLNSAGERKFQKDSSDIYATGKNLFVPEIRNDLPSAFDVELVGTKRAASHVNKVLYDDEGSRKESVSSRRKAYGSFSPAPLATPVARNDVKGNAEIGHLRQRALPLGQEITSDVGSYERVALKPEDYVPSPRSPLSTYLERCTPPTSSAPQSIRPMDYPAQPGRVRPTNQREYGMLFWVIVAFVIVIAILALLVLYNMEPSYTSPV